MNAAESTLLQDVAPPLGWFLLCCAAANLVAAGRALRCSAVVRGGAWLALTVAFAVLGGLALSGRPVGLPEGLKDLIDAAATPWSVTLAAYVGLFAVCWQRRFFVCPAVAWAILNAALLLFGLAMPDEDFAAVAAAPDNLPIVAMVFLLGFFLWLAAAQAVETDRRRATAEPAVEKTLADNILVWPDLVYIELIAALLLSAALVAWSLLVRAPLEQPANPAVTPNPSKAPWYFLGLQELLGYADAWWIGVSVPCLILLGLAAIPYLDRNPQGSGEYSLAGRRFAAAIFLYGFLLLWILPILIGTFMRGPNWSFFGPFEARDPQKITAETNVQLSEWYWTRALGREPPQAPRDAPPLARLGRALWREWLGLTLLAAYLVGLPWALGRTWLRGYRRRLGWVRYWLAALLLLLMLTLPLKMVLRWGFHISYVVAMPEYSLSF